MASEVLFTSSWALHPSKASAEGTSSEGRLGRRIELWLVCLERALGLFPASFWWSCWPPRAGRHWLDAPTTVLSSASHWIDNDASDTWCKLSISSLSSSLSLLPNCKPHVMGPLWAGHCLPSQPHFWPLPRQHPQSSQTKPQILKRAYCLRPCTNVYAVCLVLHILPFIVPLIFRHFLFRFLWGPTPAPFYPTP